MPSWSKCLGRLIKKSDAQSYHTNCKIRKGWVVPIKNIISSVQKSRRTGGKTRMGQNASMVTKCIDSTFGFINREQQF